MEDIAASETSDVEEGSLDDDRQSIMSDFSIFAVFEGGRIAGEASEVSQEKRQLIDALESRLHGKHGDDAVTNA